MRRQKRNDTIARILGALERLGWGRIIAVIALAIAGAYLSFALAVAGVTRNRNPVAALQFIPFDGVALAKQADLLFISSPESPPASVAPLARRSLRSQAINPRALRLLGYTYSQAERTKDARTFVELAASQSRREPGAQLWLVQQAARDGDLTQAIEHIDTLLRTRPSSESILFPILVRGLPDPRFRALFRQYMSKPTPWVTSMLSFAITNTDNLPALVSLIEEQKGFPKSDIAAGQARQLMGRLNDAGNFAALRRIYMLMPEAKAARLLDVRLDRSDIDESFGIAGWQSFDFADAGADLVIAGQGQGEQARPEMVIYVNPSMTRHVASKLLYLGPGRYTVTTEVSDVDRGQGGSMNWQLRCPTRKAGGRPWIGRISGNRSRLGFIIPIDCPVQFLDLIVSGGDGQTGLDATISSVSLSRATNTQS